VEYSNEKFFLIIDYVITVFKTYVMFEYLCDIFRRTWFIEWFIDVIPVANTNCSLLCHLVISIVPIKKNILYNVHRRYLTVLKICVQVFIIGQMNQPFVPGGEQRINVNGHWGSIKMDCSQHITSQRNRGFSTI
jgi:hypothetical protein